MTAQCSSFIAALALTGLLLTACHGRASRTGDWQLHVDTLRSQADGGVRQTVWLRTTGKEGPPGEVRRSAAVLSFDCFRGNASSTIMTDQALRQGSVEIRLTLDSTRPRRIPGFAGTTATGGKVLLTIPQDSVLGLLTGHRRAVVDYADGAGSSRTTAEFPVAGLAQHRTAFLAACAKAGAR